MLCIHNVWKAFIVLLYSVEKTMGDTYGATGPLIMNIFPKEPISNLRLFSSYNTKHNLLIGLYRKWNFIFVNGISLNIGKLFNITGSLIPENLTHSSLKKQSAIRRRSVRFVQIIYSMLFFKSNILF